MKTIMKTQKGTCYLCGRETYTEEHHIFEGNPNRKHSETYGLKVFLCPECHREGSEAAHKCRQTADLLHAAGQQAFEQTWGNRKKFMQIFGKNYI